MRVSEAGSDQLYDCSERLDPALDLVVAAHPRAAASPLASPAASPSWFPHRALSAVWQAWVQVCRRPGPWPQVLSLDEPGWREASDDVRPPRLSGGGLRIPGQLPAGAGDAGGDLVHQRGAPATESLSVGGPRGESRGDGGERSRAAGPCPGRDAGGQQGRGGFGGGWPRSVRGGGEP